MLPTVPTHERVRRYDRGQFHHRFAVNGLIFEGQDAALVVIEQNVRPAHLVHEGLVLGVPELNSLLFLGVDPTGESQEESLPRILDRTHGLRACHEPEEELPRERVRRRAETGQWLLAQVESLWESTARLSSLTLRLQFSTATRRTLQPAHTHGRIGR